MPKGSAELTNARREEIIAACRKLYETMSFKDITLKEIGQQTSFTRTSIYNYFETRRKDGETEHAHGNGAADPGSYTRLR